MAKRQSSLEGAKRAPRTGRAADFTRQAVGATRARRLSASQFATATLLGQFVEAAYAMFQANQSSATRRRRRAPIFRPVTSLSPGIGMRDFHHRKHRAPLLRFHCSEYDRGQSEFVAAFRGTVGGVEWWMKLQFHRPDSVPCSGLRLGRCCRVRPDLQHNRTCRVPFPAAAL